MGNCSIKSGVIEKNQLRFIKIVMDSGKILELEGSKLVHEVVKDYPGYGIFKKNSVSSSPLLDEEKLLCSHIYYLLPVGELQKKALQSDDLVKELSAEMSLNEVKEGDSTDDRLKDLSTKKGLNEVKEGDSTDDRLKDLSTKKSLNKVKLAEKGQIREDDHIKEVSVRKRLNQIKLLDKGQIAKDDNLKDISAKVSLSLNEVEPVRMSSAASDIVTSLANGSGLEVLPPPQKGIWRVKLVINTKQLEEIFSEDVNTEALIEQMRMAAASGHVTPRRARRYLGLILKPILCNVFRAANDRQQNDVEPMELCISSPIKGEISDLTHV
ncbi:hypothetical protein POM88_020050 [Heracleum sosnowskyi]|uniref:Uncharacterized protein n=1 Tax=Heracleum sosnowskyi TaxID=360622 RepID=A0AAD8IE92_9APIA|nr:hypothetical protein POM88_020050 [Heracleum sosnowskyi]